MDRHEHTIRVGDDPKIINTVGEECADESVDQMLYLLASARSGVTAEDWERNRLRRNMCYSIYSHNEAMTWVEHMKPQLRGKTVIFLGNRVAALFGIHEFLTFPIPGEDWTAIPLPRPAFYNNPAHQAVVEIFLSDIIQEFKDADIDHWMRRVHRPEPVQSRPSKVPDSRYHGGGQQLDFFT